MVSSLSQSIGAADKVFELMYRRPKRTDPSTNIYTNPLKPVRISMIKNPKKNLAGVETTRTKNFRSTGAAPTTCHGEISLEKIYVFYPGRPQKWF